MNKFLIITFIILANTANAVTPNRVVIIDTGLDLEQLNQPYMCKDYPAINVNDSKNYIDNWPPKHGSAIVDYIGTRILGSIFCITLIKIDITLEKDIVESTVKALQIAENLKPFFINMSWAGDVSSEKELTIIKRLLAGNTAIFVSVGNDGFDLDKNCNVFPACYKKTLPDELKKNYFVIGSNAFENSNKGSIVSFTDVDYKIIYKGRNIAGTSISSPMKMTQILQQIDKQVKDLWKH